MPASWPVVRITPSPRMWPNATRVSYRGAGPVRRARIIDPWLAKIEEWVERSLCQDPRRSLLCQAESVGVRGFGPHGAPSGGGGQEELRGGSAAGVSAVDPRAGHVGAVGLGRGPGHFWAKDESVLCVAGVVEVPGGDRDLGPHPAHGDWLCGSGDASLWRRSNLLAHRQRAHGHDRPHRWDRCAPSGDGRGRRPLRDHGGDVCAGGPRVQRRVSEATVRIAKADLVPTDANLRGDYTSWAELAEACEAWMAEVNGRQSIG